MSVQRFLAMVAGKLAELVPLTSSAGAASAGSIPALNASGLIDTTMLPAAIANIQIALPTTSIAANSCTTPATVSMPGLKTTSALLTAFATNPNSVNGWGLNGGLVFTAWPTANTLNWSVCNETSAAIVPGAMTLNVGAW
jgi:hypothetical protein